MHWTGLAIILLEGLALAVALTSFWIARRIRRPPRRTYASAVARGQPGDPRELPSPREFTEWSLEWRGVALPVWDIPGDDPDGPAVVCTPGWADSKIGVLSRLDALLPFASRVVAWDPPGLGEAPDWPKGPLGGWPMGTADVDALRALVERVAASRVVLFGWSAGAGVSVAAASQRGPSPAPPTSGRGSDETPLPRSGRGEGEVAAFRVVAVIAEAPYRQPWTPARNVLRAMGMPWRVVGPLAFGALGVRFGLGPTWKGKGGFDRAAHARHLGCPLLVLHGDADEVCPLADGEAIAHAAKRGSLAVIRGGHHNDLWTDDRLCEQCVSVVADFLARDAICPFPLR